MGSSGLGGLGRVSGRDPVLDAFAVLAHRGVAKVFETAGDRLAFAAGLVGSLPCVRWARELPSYYRLTAVSGVSATVCCVQVAMGMALMKSQIASQPAPAAMVTRPRSRAASGTKARNETGTAPTA
jgi:hypothetical protein